MLECLVRRTGLIVSKERLQQALAQPDQDVTPMPSRCTFRGCAPSSAAPPLIRSLRGLGYRLEEAKLAVNSSISRQLVFWLAVPLTLLALCGALVHYFNNVAPAADQQRSPAEGGRAGRDRAPCSVEGGRRRSISHRTTGRGRPAA